MIFRDPPHGDPYVEIDPFGCAATLALMFLGAAAAAYGVVLLLRAMLS